MNPVIRYQEAAIDWLEYYEGTKSLGITLLQMQAFAWPIWILLLSPEYETIPVGTKIVLLVFVFANLPFAVLSTLNFALAIKHHAEFTYRLYRNHGQTKLSDYQEQ
jgi:hypothetical protein